MKRTYAEDIVLGIVFNLVSFIGILISLYSGSGYGALVFAATWFISAFWVWYTVCENNKGS